jgi:anti-sigma regulatory factor (Ser/Thr protein kinase)
MHAQYTFFHQGFNLLKEIEPQMRSLGKQVGAHYKYDSVIKISVSEFELNVLKIIYKIININYNLTQCR